MDHVATIDDPDVRDQYRHELLQRFDALDPAAAAARPWHAGPARPLRAAAAPGLGRGEGGRPHRPQPRARPRGAAGAGPLSRR